MPAIWDGPHYLIWDARNLRTLVFEVSSSDEQELCAPTKPLEEVEASRLPPPKWLTAVLVLTNRCNLGCTYCYAEANRHSKANGAEGMTCQQVETILGGCLQRDIDRLYVSFLGGEPTLKPDCLKAAAQFLGEAGVPYSFHITTNGICPDFLQDWLIDSGFDFTVSSDGIPTDHDSQRPTVGGRSSSQRVERFIRRLADRGALFQVRATLTRQNVRNLPLAIEYWASLGVRFVHFELVDLFGRARFDKSPPDLQHYIDNFPDVLETAQNLGVYLVNSAFMKLLTPGTKFCTSTQGHRLHFNPDGSISSCYKVQRGFEGPADFVMGAVTCGRFIMDEPRRESLAERGADYFVECQLCFARSVCGGGCPLHHQLHAPTGHVDTKLCEVKRSLLRQAILQIHDCSIEGQASVLFGSTVYDALVEQKFQSQSKQRRSQL
ncbi:MAG: radical SAM protein [Candidatus Eisenbacteria bacterium]|uniref:Radical SAM protein n=1 Tax=Eiseniibacteriota bacterium TaxID=2212470 RepID=A0A948RWE3_UNCEI|nr:radical SAM protein [Candidatus Eisenbacteria bacterium]MBU1950705.1 radical SAM protein [Candidatus Eisenbacteria bacterium]MBU2690884.1 radical SAM protein [Candidatus Eisenbacteria bacterium]